MFFCPLWLWRVELIRLSFVFSRVPVWKIRVGKLCFGEHRGDWQLCPNTRSEVSTAVRTEATHKSEVVDDKVVDDTCLCSQDPGV